MIKFHPRTGFAEYSARWEVPGSTEIDIVTAKAFHDKGVIFMDMGHPDIWAKEHIPGAVNLPAERSGTGPWKNLMKCLAGNNWAYGENDYAEHEELA